MPVRPIPRDPNGGIILPGRVKKVLEFPFMVDTSLPSTLTTAGVSGGNTVTCANQSSGLGELVITSVGATVQVLTAATVNLASFEAVLWEAEGVYCPDDNLNTLGIGINASGAGVYCQVAQKQMKLNPGGTNVVTLNVENDTGWWKRHRNIGLLVLPRYKHAYYLMGDQVIADVDYSGGAGSSGTMTLGAVQPAIFCSAQTSTTSVLHVQQLRLTTVAY